MQVDVIMLTNSSIKDSIFHTKRSIYTMRDSEEMHKFNINLVESGEVTDYAQLVSNYIVPKEPFNYNRFINLAMPYLKSDWVVISNNDVGYEKGWFSEILKVHEDRPDIESFSPKDPLLYMKYFDWHFINSPDQYFESYIVSEALMGWCLVIKRSALAKISPFDEQFDMYYQDNDYAEMLKIKGIKHALVRNSIACHLQTINIDKFSDEKKRKIKLDEIKFLKKWKLHK